MLSRCMKLSTKLEMDIILYDYEGYGYSDGKSTESAIKRDLEAVFKYALGLYRSEQIFLYGESSMEFEL